MKTIKQLSILLENKPGMIRQVCEVLQQNQINILTLTLADTTQFGLLRFLVRDTAAAKDILVKAGFTVIETDVLALPVPNVPGGLASLLNVLDGAGLNVEYMYAYTSGQGCDAVMIFRFDDPAAALTGLEKAGIATINIDGLA
ncbi:MAG: amino acid-binding protein [Lentisphaeria bacterium]|nr:amino acid-binding protein [Lentisphaeria bacterium]